MSSKEKKDQLSEVLTVGEDWDWDKIQDVWDRLSYINDFYKSKGFDLQWVSKGSLFSAMQTMLLDCGCDVTLARATLIDLVLVSLSYVADRVLAVMKSAWNEGRVGSQKLSAKEKATLQSNITLMEEGINVSRTPMMNEEMLAAALQAQDHVSSAAEEAGNLYGPEATIRAISLMLQQAALFANNTEVMAAKASILEIMHQTWPVAISTTQRLLNSAMNQVNNGPPGERPN